MEIHRKLTILWLTKLLFPSLNRKDTANTPCLAPAPVSSESSRFTARFPVFSWDRRGSREHFSPPAGWWKKTKCLANNGINLQNIFPVVHDFLRFFPSTFCGIFKAYPGNARRNWFSWVGKSINKMLRACNRNLTNYFWLQLKRWLNKPFEKYAPRNGSSPQVSGGENKESLKQVL